MLRCGLLVAVALGGTLLQAPHPLVRGQGSTFASRIAALSEPGGYFDTDNLISNERSYLQVMPELRRVELRGGAYVGVGPDQNFSYIAAVRPSIAFIIDIRRDNMLLHLLFKVLFRLSRTRADYLARLFGRPVPPDLNRWRNAPVERLVGYLDGTASDIRSTEALRAHVNAAVKQFGVPLSRDDLETIDRFHRRFIESGLGLRFQSSGRPPQSYYPTYRELLLEKDPLGTPGNYLASDEAFQIVRTLQARDLVIPVVGNLSGPAALVAIGGLLAQRGERISVFYASNVEFYLFGDGTFMRFAANLRRIPHTRSSVIIRSVFGRGSWQYARPGDASSTHAQSITELLDAVAKGRIQTYRDLIEY